jgi:hypothetical protein
VAVGRRLHIKILPLEQMMRDKEKEKHSQDGSPALYILDKK